MCRIKEGRGGTRGPAMVAGARVMEVKIEKSGSFRGELIEFVN